MCAEISQSNCENVVYSTPRVHNRWILRGSTVPTSTFLPSDRRIPNSIGLALSGGGFRATLFHLGAIRRLNEFGIAAQLTSISSVSGGSILNGFLASRLDPPLSAGVTDYEGSVSQPIREFSL